MFCFQCEQTAGCSGCTGAAGVCGKKADIAERQDKLTGALVGLAKANVSADKLVIEALFATITNVNFNSETLLALIDRVKSISPNIVTYNMKNLWNEDEDIRSLKSLILFGIRGMAAYAYHAEVLGYTEPEVNRFFL